MRRDAMIEAVHEPSPGGGVTVRLKLSDGKGEVMALSLLAPDEGTAAAMEKAFRTDAEGVYQRITEILTDGKIDE